MIELQKYSKIDEDQLLKRVTTKHQDSRLKVVGYASLAIVVTLVGLTYQIGRTTFLASDEKALNMFEADSNSETMKAYVNFISEMGRSYADKKETARRYRIFKQNYEKVQKHSAHERHLPFSMTMNNQFADLTAEEFLEQIGGGAIVPQSVM